MEAVRPPLQPCQVDGKESVPGKCLACGMHPGKGSFSFWLCRESSQSLLPSGKWFRLSGWPVWGYPGHPGQRLLITVWLQGELVAVQQLLLRATLVPLQFCSCREVVRSHFPRLHLAGAAHLTCLHQAVLMQLEAELGCPGACT